MTYSHLLFTRIDTLVFFREVLDRNGSEMNCLYTVARSDKKINKKEDESSCHRNKKKVERASANGVSFTDFVTWHYAHDDLNLYKCILRV